MLLLCNPWYRVQYELLCPVITSSGLKEKKQKSESFYVTQMQSCRKNKLVLFSSRASDSFSPPPSPSPPPPFPSPPPPPGPWTSYQSTN